MPEEHIRIVDPNDLAETERVLREELASDTPSVVICRRPCALLKYVKHNPPLVIDHDKCVGCKACMKIGCPCISVKDGKAIYRPDALQRLRSLHADVQARRHRQQISHAFKDKLIPEKGV